VTGLACIVGGVLLVACCVLIVLDLLTEGP
jgi:hypothetical protein